MPTLHIVITLKNSGCFIIILGRENWSVVLQRHSQKVPVGKDVWTQQSGSDKDQRERQSLELHDLHYRPNIIIIINSSRMQWSGHVACMLEMNYSRTPLIRTLVIRNSNYPDLFVPPCNCTEFVMA